MAMAQGSAPYPSKPLRIIVPFAPGGGTDLTARLVGQRLAERLAQPVVIDNRPGAGTMLGTELTQKAVADGYTLMIASASHAINPTLYRKVNQEITGALEFPSIREKLLALGAEPWPTSPATAQTFIATEVARWGTLIKAARISAE